MPHTIWTGTVSFGLVAIPVTLVTAEVTGERIRFNMLDGRDLSPIKQRRVNERTGEEVAWDDIVKGYDVGSGRYVVMTDEDFAAADIEATQTIDVLSAVAATEIRPEYFDKPYYLVPTKQGRKAYALLRETLARSGRVALGKVVIRTRQRLVALVPEGDALLLEILRYPSELRGTEGLDLPGAAEQSGVTEAELAIAQQLVAAIARPFVPDEELYSDTYHDRLVALIGRKAEGMPAATPIESAPEPVRGEVIDIAALLKRSLEQVKKAAG